MSASSWMRAASAPARARPTGRISARILSDGPALLVETLDIVDLAGANARVRGRIAPDGSGRIAGKVTAQRADPLVDLLGSVWIGGISKLVPHFVREGALDLDVASERVAPVPGSTELRLRTTAKGRVAGGPFEGRVESVDGRTESLTIGLSTDNTGRWVNRANLAGLNRPSQDRSSRHPGRIRPVQRHPRRRRRRREDRDNAALLPERGRRRGG